jgi:hypothetical protein
MRPSTKRSANIDGNLSQPTRCIKRAVKVLPLFLRDHYSTTLCW